MRVRSPSPAPSAALADGFDLARLGEDFYRDPYPYYHALRTHAPVKRMENGGCFLTRYADALAVYRDPLRCSSDKQAEFAPKYGDTPLFAHHTTSLLIADFAAAIPVEVIGNLLGVPPAERDPLRGWSLAILGALEPTLTAAMHDRGNRAVRECLPGRPLRIRLAAREK